MTALIICTTILIIFFTYCFLPIKKMEAVNKEFKELLRILPISQIVQIFRGGKKDSS
jgi:hypothetical protein